MFLHLFTDVSKTTELFILSNVFKLNLTKPSLEEVIGLNNELFSKTSKWILAYIMELVMIE